MVENLVVIAAHGDKYIQGCIKSLGNKYPILVVDTFSETPIRVEVDTLRLPLHGYPTGAFIWAYLFYPANNYLFIQDSVQALTLDYLEPFKELQPDRGAVGWSSFKPSLVTDEELAQNNFVHFYYEATSEEAILGPIFYTNKKSLDELRDKKLLPPMPMNKKHDMACEIMWSLAFKQAGMEVKFIELDYLKAVVNKESKVFRKEFAGRQ